MRRKTFALLTAWFLFCFSLQASTSRQETNPKMTTEEKAQVIKWLKESEQETIAAIENLGEAQWTFKPAPERWSVGEVSEHILLAEGLLFAQVEKALATPQNPEWQEKTRGKTELLEQVMAPRKGRAQAPESIVPTGKMTKSEFITKFRAVRAQTLKFTESCDLPLKAHTTEHPFPIFNTLNAYQWLIYIPLHNLRHNKQIAEVKAHTAYPKE